MAQVVRKWMVNAPDKQNLAIPGPMGSDSLKLAHGSFIYNESLAKYYGPNYFIPVIEEIPDPEEVTLLLTEDQAPEVKLQKTPAPEKKQDNSKRAKTGGRKKGTPNKSKKK